MSRTVRRGFSLIEVVIATSIVGTIMYVLALVIQSNAEVTRFDLAVNESASVARKISRQIFAARAGFPEVQGGVVLYAAHPGREEVQARGKLVGGAGEHTVQEHMADARGTTDPSLLFGEVPVKFWTWLASSCLGPTKNTISNKEFAFSSSQNLSTGSD